MTSDDAGQRRAPAAMAPAEHGKEEPVELNGDGGKRRTRRESIAARPLSSPQWRLVWLALALHVVGLAVDTVFHDSEERPFGVFDMLWAHGLSYLGALAAVVGGWRAARASATRAGCRWIAALTAALGIVQALALALDFITELAGAQEPLGSLVYVSSLVPMILATFVGAWLCRRAALATGPPTARG